MRTLVIAVLAACGRGAAPPVEPRPPAPPSPHVSPTGPWRARATSTTSRAWIEVVAPDEAGCLAMLENVLDYRVVVPCQVAPLPPPAAAGMAALVTPFDGGQHLVPFMTMDACDRERLQRDATARVVAQDILRSETVAAQARLQEARGDERTACEHAPPGDPICGSAVSRRATAELLLETVTHYQVPASVLRCVRI